MAGAVIAPRCMVIIGLDEWANGKGVTAIAVVRA
jgi:hypothetical protein